jgi:hypothetical protein
MTRGCRLSAFASGNVLESPAFGEFADGLHTSLDRQPFRIEDDVVQARILLLDVEIGAHGAGAGGIVTLELRSHRGGVLGAAPVHQDAHPEIHRCAHPDADDARQVGRSSVATPQPLIRTLSCWARRRIS